MYFIESVRNMLQKQQACHEDVFLFGDIPVGPSLVGR
jgi:hypothetical protein